MIYLDNGATTLHKPQCVLQAVSKALQICGNPGRGGHAAAMAATNVVYQTRETAATFFDCDPENVVFTNSCTHGLNIAIGTLVKPGDRVLISGFEHNAVTRPLYALNAKIFIAGRKLFDQKNMLEEWEKILKNGVEAAIFTHVSNAFGFILPAADMARLCIKYNTPFIIDAAQSAGILDISMKILGADFIAMPGHKGLLGPQGTGILLCGRHPKPLLFGGTGSMSALQEMPEELPDRLEAGTLNVPGIAGLGAGIRYLQNRGLDAIFAREATQARRCAVALKELGLQVFCGDHQTGTVSFLPGEDPEEFAEKLAQNNIAVRAGLHCAPTAHESAGTLETGTVRVSFGHDATTWQTDRFLQVAQRILSKKYLQ